MFNYTEERRELDSLRWELEAMKAKLEEANRFNSDRERLVNKLSKAEKLAKELSDLKKYVWWLYERVVSEDAEFKGRRIEYAEMKITEVLAEIEPHKGFVAKIYHNPQRGGKSYLRLHDKFNKGRNPRISEGKHVQSVVSNAASTAFCEVLGADKMYMDEPFAATHSETRSEEINRIIKRMLDKGMQVFLVEQASDNYKDLPRREIHLELDPVKDEVLPPTYFDY